MHKQGLMPSRAEYVPTAPARLTLALRSFESLIRHVSTPLGIDVALD